MQQIYPPLLQHGATDVPDKDDVCPPGVAGNPFDHKGDRLAEGLQWGTVRGLRDDGGDLRDEFVAHPIPDSGQQILAIGEVLVEVPVVQRGSGAHAPHGDGGPALFDPDLLGGADQSLPAFGTALCRGTSAP
ncbi:Uncharacterised protein [Mycobacteroides abscessus subsp. abscessus]|nr:Uncharacterised protein [Mycobacteroides abscessus subsp. abscessus]